MSSCNFLGTGALVAQLLLHDLYRRVLVCGIISGYATFCALAGVDKTDTRAALAKLPPVDGEPAVSILESVHID